MFSIAWGSDVVSLLLCYESAVAKRAFTVFISVVDTSALNCTRAMCVTGAMMPDF